MAPGTYIICYPRFLCKFFLTFGVLFGLFIHTPSILCVLLGGQRLKGSKVGSILIPKQIFLYPFLRIQRHLLILLLFLFLFLFLLGFSQADTGLSNHLDCQLLEHIMIVDHLIECELRDDWDKQVILYNRKK